MSKSLPSNISLENPGGLSYREVVFRNQTERSLIKERSVSKVSINDIRLLEMVLNLCLSPPLLLKGSDRVSDLSPEQKYGLESDHMIDESLTHNAFVYRIRTYDRSP